MSVPDPAGARIHVAIHSDPLDPAAEYAATAGPENGGRVLFSGCVRATEGDATIDALDYEHYEAMARRELEELAREACARWPLRAVRLVHRVGRVPVGEESVVVAVGAGHRAEAFEAARHLIDELKLRVPIWKSAPATSDAPSDAPSAPPTANRSDAAE